MGFPAPATLTSHQPPALLVAELIRAEANGAAGQTTLLNPDGLDLLQMLEGGAQSVAVILGQALRDLDGPAASGMLVGSKDVVLHRPARPGECVQVSATLAHTLEPFRLYEITVTSGDGDLLLTAELKTMSTNVQP